MKISIIIALTLILGILLLYACSPKTQKKIAKKPVEKLTEKTSVEEPVSIMNPTGTAVVVEKEKEEPKEAEEELPKVFLQASLKKTACYGKCPVYELKLYSSGKASYTGKAFVDRIGNYEAIVPTEKMNQIIQQANAIDYFDLSENYPVSKIGIPDLPNTISYLKVGEREKQIFNNHAAPKTLLDYEKFVEEMIAELDWKKIEQTN